VRGWKLIVARLALVLIFPLGPVLAAEPDPAALELYGIRLLQSGSRLRSYPEEAVRDKLSGTAVISLSLGANGQLSRQQLQKSSGHTVLDEHAMAMLSRAVPVTEIPTNLTGTAFTIQVSVVFALP
jgi:protein TonB